MKIENPNEMDMAREFTLAIEAQSPQPPNIKTNNNSPTTMKHL